MLIQGTILKIDPPDYQDNYGNHYQNITVQTTAGPIIGRKASKTPYGVQDINRQVSWECEQKTNKKGPYNKFTKPQDPQYTQPQQGPQQAAQGQTSASPRDYDAENRGKIRTQFVKAAIISNQINIGLEPIEIINYWTEYAMTGVAPLPPARQQAGELLGQPAQEPPWES